MLESGTYNKFRTGEWGEEGQEMDPARGHLCGGTGGLPGGLVNGAHVVGKYWWVISARGQCCCSSPVMNIAFHQSPEQPELCFKVASPLICIAVGCCEKGTQGH